MNTEEKARQKARDDYKSAVAYFRYFRSPLIYNNQYAFASVESLAYQDEHKRLCKVEVKHIAEKDP